MSIHRWDEGKPEGGSPFLSNNNAACCHKHHGLQGNIHHSPVWTLTPVCKIQIILHSVGVYRPQAALRNAVKVPMIHSFIGCNSSCRCLVCCTQLYESCRSNYEQLVRESWWKCLSQIWRQSEVQEEMSEESSEVFGYEGCSWWWNRTDTSEPFSGCGLFCLKQDQNIYLYS